MSLQVEKLENNMAKLTIEVPADDLEKALQSAYMKQKNKIAMPGFRKGKVPRQMIEKMYGPEIFYDDAANALIPKAYSEAYEECELEIVSRPEINVVQIEKGKSFIFTADVATKPEVKLGEYKGLEVDKVSTRVTQKEVDAKIQEEAEKNAREVVVTDRAVADGDEVILDFEGFVDGEAFEGGHIIHGAANAMYLPKVIKFNAKDETAAKRYAYIADFLGLGGDTTEAKIDNLIAMLRKMNDELNIPQCIKNYGEGGLPAEQGIVPEDEFLAKLPEVAANAISDACTGSNPRQPSQEEMEKLLKCCYYDTEVDF